MRIPDRSAHGFFGPVAQRRRRVFLVGVLGSPHAAEILFERESLRWDHPKGREAREALAEHPPIRAGIGGSAGFKYHNSGRCWDVGYEEDNSPTLVADYHQPAVLTPWDAQSKRVYSENGTSPTLCNSDGRGVKHNQPIVLQSDGSSSNGSQNGCGYNDDGSAYTLNGRDRQSVCIKGSMVGREDKNGPQGSGVNDDVSFTLNTTDRHAVAFAQNTRDKVRIFQGDGQVVGALAAQPGMKQTSYICMQDGQAKGGISEDVSTTLNASHEQPIVCAADDNGKTAIEEDLCGSLKVGGGSPWVAFSQAMENK